jgi:hypothetical protein
MSTDTRVVDCSIYNVEVINTIVRDKLFTNLSTSQEVLVYTIGGNRIVSKFVNEGPVSIDLSTLSVGMYIFKTENKSYVINKQ